MILPTTIVPIALQTTSVEYPLSRVTPDKIFPGTFLIEFGDLFQGRNKTFDTAIEVLKLSTTGFFGEAFFINVPVGEERFTVFSSKNYISPVGDTDISVGVMDKKIGGPNAESLPFFEIYFPRTNESIRVNLNWNNYWVTAIASVAEDTNGETIMYNKWLVRVQITARTIPAKEKLRVEVLLDDTTQMPTPLRKLLESGVYDESMENLIEIKGRRGVMVTLDATAGALGVGSFAETPVYIKKTAVPSTDIIYANFGEHSDKGIYAKSSNYITFSSEGGKFNFTITAVVPELGLTSSTASIKWMIAKEAPVSVTNKSFDGIVSCRVVIPNKYGINIGYVIVMLEGEMSKEIITERYQRGTSVEGNKLITATGDPEFNSRYVTFSGPASYTVQAMEVGLELPADSGKYITVTGITGEVVNGPLIPIASITYKWDELNDYYVKGGKIEITQLLIARRYTTREILSIGFFEKGMDTNLFSVGEIVKRFSSYYYELYLHVKSVKDTEGTYAPFEYYLEAGSLSVLNSDSVTFKMKQDAIPATTIENVTTIVPITGTGLSVVYNHLTKKYYANGTSTKATISSEVIGVLSRVVIPKERLYIRNLKLSTDGTVTYSYGTIGENFAMEEFTMDGIDKPMIDLSISKTSIGVSLIITPMYRFVAKLREGVAPQDLIIAVEVVDESTHTALPITTISILKDMPSGMVLARVPAQSTTCRITMNFAPTGNEDAGFIYGTSPAEMVIPAILTYG